MSNSKLTKFMTKTQQSVLVVNFMTLGRWVVAKKPQLCIRMWVFVSQKILWSAAHCFWDCFYYQSLIARWHTSTYDIMICFHVIVIVVRRHSQLQRRISHDNMVYVNIEIAPHGLYFSVLSIIVKKSARGPGRVGQSAREHATNVSPVT